MNDVFTSCLICGHADSDHSAGRCHNTEPCLCQPEDQSTPDNPAGIGCAVGLLAAAVIVCALIGTWTSDSRWWITALVVGIGAALAYSVHKLLTLP